MRALDSISRHPRLGAFQDMASLGRRRDFQAGRVLFSQGAGASYAALIVSGLVKVTAVSGPGSHETFLAIRGPGELLGEDAAFRQNPAQGSSRDGRLLVATALTALTARVFPAEQLRRYLYDHPAAAFALARTLGERLAEAESRIASAGRDNADRRLAQLLCDLERYGEPEHDGAEAGIQLPVRLSHAELAAWIGACRETVDRALRRWRDRKIISTSYRTIVIHDRKSLGRIAGIRITPRRPIPANPAAAATWPPRAPGLAAPAAQSR